MTGGIDQRVFLVGCPRSGTTLLQSMLASHSRIASFPETHFFERGFAEERDLSVKRVLTPVLGGFYLGLILSDWVDELDKLGYEICDLDRPSRKWSRAAAVNDLVGLLDTLTLNDSKNVWVEKTPRHVLRINTISNYVNEPKFVHIVRDGRAVVASLHDASGRYPAYWGGRLSSEECVSMWNACITSTFEHVGRQNHFVVAYERLLKDPEKHLRELCSFLGMRYETSMASRYASANARIVSGYEAWKENNSGPLRDAGLAKYRELFSERQRRAIEKTLDWSKFDRTVETSGK